MCRDGRTGACGFLLFAVSETGPCILGWLQAISYAAEGLELLMLPVLRLQTYPSDLPGAGDGAMSFIHARGTLLPPTHKFLISYL